jgi:hypothetical protein
VEVRPPSQSDSRVATREHFTVQVLSLLRGGDRFEGQMQDGTITTESSPGRMGSVGRTPVECHSGMGTGVHTLQSCSIYSYSRVLGHGHSPNDMFVPHVLGFLPPPIGECVVSRGCIRLEERGSIYCRMDLPGPTTSVGTRTDYSVGLWDYSTCAARYLMA